MSVSDLSEKKQWYAFRALPLALVASVVVGRAQNFIGMPDAFLMPLAPIAAIGYGVLACAMARRSAGLGASIVLGALQAAILGLCLQRLLEAFLPSWPVVLVPQLLVEFWFVQYAPEKISILSALGLIFLHLALMSERRCRPCAVIVTFCAWFCAVFSLNDLAVDTTFLGEGLSGFSVVCLCIGCAAMALRLSGAAPFDVFFNQNGFGLTLRMAVFLVAFEPFLIGRFIQTMDQHHHDFAAIVTNAVAVAACVKLGLMVWFASIFDKGQTQLKRAAQVDHLTGLLNRHGLARQIAQRDYTAVVMLDIDAFKQINDTLGHDAGDRLLVQTAKALKACLQPDEVLARWGGDEFLVLSQAKSVVHLTALSERLRRAVASLPAVQIDGASVAITLSQGYATMGLDAKGFSEAIQRADQALYAAKHVRHNQADRAQKRGLGQAAAQHA